MTRKSKVWAAKMCTFVNTKEQSLGNLNIKTFQDGLERMMSIPEGNNLGSPRRKATEDDGNTAAAGHFPTATVCMKACRSDVMLTSRNNE